MIIYRHSTCIYNLKFNALNEIPVVFHNGSNYDHHFIIKELANEFEGKFKHLGGKHRKEQNYFRPNSKRNYKNC